MGKNGQGKETVKKECGLGTLNGECEEEKRKGVKKVEERKK